MSYIDVVVVVVPVGRTCDTRVIMQQLLAICDNIKENIMGDDLSTNSLKHEQVPL